MSNNGVTDEDWRLIGYVIFGKDRMEERGGEEERYYTSKRLCQHIRDCIIMRYFEKKTHQTALIKKMLNKQVHK